MRLAYATVFIVLPTVLWAQDYSAAIDAALDTHVLPGVEQLAETTADLAEAASADCTATSSDLRRAYGAAFDAWIHVGHLRFGPFEAENRAFALAFWPDGRGATPRSLAGLIDDEDLVARDVADYATVSIAARGFYAMEFLLYDDDLTARGDDAYRCQLVRVVAQDIAVTSAAIAADWSDTHADLMRNAGQNDRYRSPEDAMRTLFGALTTGLEFNADVRLGRPLGTFERPRPTRAEARRSGRSLQNLTGSLLGLQELYRALATGAPGAGPEIDAAFAAALDAADRLDDPTFASVADPSGRFRVEVLQQRIVELRQAILTDLGPDLGVTASFNALDGD
ncbi:imelysin family protein [Gymnodinialimonas sp. 2305UL16-5]|uniref:imelysin family protein n=1 Tax=Gymnodinialimonas mytili TaxID=3126503 RepID=UPI00309F6097